MYALRIGDSSGGWTQFPLMPPAARPELLKISRDGCLKEDGRYQLRIVTDSSENVTDAQVVIDGEEVAQGLSAAAASYRDTDGNLLHVYEPVMLDFFSGSGQILLLIHGFARIEVSLTLAGGTTVNLESDDIPVLVRGDREEETERVEGMFDALFSAPPTRPLQWMLTGTPSTDERFSIVEGGATSPASRSLSTFLQVTDQILADFERLLPSFRAHVRSSISQVPTRVPGNKVRTAGPREAQWIASHPDVLQRSRSGCGIKLGDGFYMPRYVQTERRTRSYDTYENRVIVSFLAACGQRLGRLSSMIDLGRGLSEEVEKALNPFRVEGYVLSSLLVASSSFRRGESVKGRADALRRKASALEQAYRLATPGVEPARFLPPRRSKVFQEVVPYTKLYELMMRWCTMGDLDMRGSLLALRTPRMDRFYEYYVLLAMLTRLDGYGFAPSGAVDVPIGVVEYSLATTSRYFRNERQVANKYVLRGAAGTVTLYYQPVIYGDSREENGIRLHRTSVGVSGRDSYYTPDFLLVYDGDTGRKTLVIDAKYRYTRGVMEGSPESEFQKCLRKYRQEVSSVNGPPDAVWLLCGRDSEPEVRYWERSSWALTSTSFVRSGAMTLMPTGDALDEMFQMVGIQPDAGVPVEPTTQTQVELERSVSVAADKGAEELKPQDEGEQNSDQQPPSDGDGDDDLQPPSIEPADCAPNETEEASTQDATEVIIEAVRPPTDGGAAIQQDDAKRKKSAGGSKASKKAGRGSATAKGNASTGNASRDNATRAMELVKQLWEALGQGQDQLYSDGWSRKNIGLGRPVLRATKPQGRESSKYVPFVLGDEEVYLAKHWTPVNLNRASQLLRRLAK